MGCLAKCNEIQNETRIFADFPLPPGVLTSKLCSRVENFQNVKSPRVCPPPGGVGWRKQMTSAPKQMIRLNN